MSDYHEERMGKETSERELEKMRLAIEKLQLDVNAIDQMEANEKKKKSQLDLVRTISTQLVKTIQGLVRQLKEKQVLIRSLAEAGDVSAMMIQEAEMKELVKQLEMANKQSIHNLAAQKAKHAHAAQEAEDYHTAAGSRAADEAKQRRSANWRE